MNPAITGPGALSYSSYLGVAGVHNGFGIAVGSDGTMYIGGYTAYQDVYPTANAFQPGFGGGLSDGFLIVMGP